MGHGKFNDHYLKANGINAEDVKKEYKCNPVSYYNLYNEDTVKIRDDAGNLWADTEMTKDEFFSWYGDEDEYEDED